MEQQVTGVLESFIRAEQPHAIYHDQLAVVELSTGIIESEEFADNPVYQRSLSFLLISRGEISVHVDFVPYRLGHDSGLIVHKNHTYDQVYLSPDFKGMLIVASLDFLFATLHDEDTPSVEELMAMRYSPVHRFREDDMPVIWDIIYRLRNNMKRSDHRFQKSLVRNEFSNLLAELWEMGEKKNVPQGKTPRDDYQDELAARFLELLMNNCRREHEINFYAEELCVTPVYLSRMIKRISGKPASQWIANSIMAVAKVLLRKPGVTVQEVAAELNFSDQSSFGKFFKKHAGCSPLEYKNNLK